MKIVLNKARIVAKAREAYLKGELQCQKADFQPGDDFVCLYASPCAIGAALTPEQREFLDARTAPRIRSLWYDGYVECSKDDMKFLDNLQVAHDARNFDELNVLLGVDF